MGTAYCDVAEDENLWYTVDAQIALRKGENTIKMVFANEPNTEYEYWNKPYAMPVPPEDIQLAKLTITKQ